MITKEILEKERFLLTIIRSVKYETKVEGTPWSLNVYKVDNEENDFDIIISHDNSFMMLLLGEIGIVARFIDNNAAQRLVLRNKNLFPEMYHNPTLLNFYFIAFYTMYYGFIDINDKKFSYFVLNDGESRLVSVIPNIPQKFKYEDDKVPPIFIAKSKVAFFRRFGMSLDDIYDFELDELKSNFFFGNDN